MYQNFQGIAYDAQHVGSGNYQNGQFQVTFVGTGRGGGTVTAAIQNPGDPVTIRLANGNNPFVATPYDDPNYILFQLDAASEPSNGYFVVSNQSLTLGQILTFSNGKLGDYIPPGSSSAPPIADHPLFGTVEHSTNSAAGTLYGLFNGLLGHSPQPLAYEGFVTQLNANVSPEAVASQIMSSVEYANLHPLAQSDSDYIQSLYLNALQRSPDSAGQSFYQGELNAGITRAAVAVQVATSAEAQAHAASDFREGEFIPNQAASDVARLYYGVLGRAPDAGGLQAFTQAVQQGGTTLQQLAQTMLNSQEFNATRQTAPTTDAQFVDLVYTGALGRHADAGGSAYWTDALAHGATRADVAVQISESVEAHTHLVRSIEAGWILQG